MVASGPVPYQILIYVDPTMVNSHELQCSLDLLVSKAIGLTGIAAVDFVIANPEPRFVLRRAQGPEMLENLLASYDWKQEASDEIRALRAGFLEALAETESAEDLQTLRQAFAREEERIVQERLDLLLAFLAGQDQYDRHRALLLVGMNFDLEPAAFYKAWGNGSGERNESGSAGPANLGQSWRSTAAALAAYGWISYPVAAPLQEDPLLPGMRIGKWRLAGPAGGRIIGIKITRESERDPELARAHLENGQALLAAGRLEESEAAFREALHHFHGDPSTARQQAEALVGLADALEGQGLADEARSMRAQAGELDPSVVTQDPTALATLLAPTEALDILAAETSGRVIHEGGDLETSLLALQRRVRLTFQVSGQPPGEDYPVEVRFTRRDWDVGSPSRVRFGTPPLVALARTRLLIAGDIAEPPLVLDARAQRDAAGGQRATVEFRLPLMDGEEDVPPETNQACRMSMAWLAEDEVLEVAQRRVDCQAASAVLTGSLTTEAPVDSELVALVVEHLASGAWGAEIFEIGSAAN